MHHLYTIIIYFFNHDNKSLTTNPKHIRHFNHNNKEKAKIGSGKEKMTLHLESVRLRFWRSVVHWPPCTSLVLHRRFIYFGRYSISLFTICCFLSIDLVYSIMKFLVPKNTLLDLLWCFIYCVFWKNMKEGSDERFGFEKGSVASVRADSRLPLHHRSKRLEREEKTCCLFWQSEIFFLEIKSGNTIYYKFMVLHYQ